MVIRVSHPGKPTKLVDLGSHGNGSPLPLKAMRLPIDEAIEMAARRGHPIKVGR